MIAYLVLIATVNTVLGFAIAVYLLPPAQLSWLPARIFGMHLWRFGSSASPRQIMVVEGNMAEPSPIVIDAIPELDTKSEGAADADVNQRLSNARDVGSQSGEPSVSDLVKYDPGVVEQIPEGWLTTLDEYGIEAASMVEASAQVLRLEVGIYREQLMHIDSRARALVGIGDASSFRMLVKELSDINAAWLEKQTDSTRHLESRSDSLGNHGETALQLLRILENQQAQIETTAGNLSEFDIDADLARCEPLLLNELRRLLDLAHALRDHMLEMLLEIKKVEDRLCDIDRSMVIDRLTNLHNRAGLEKVLDEQFISKQGRQRLVSCGLIDVDRFTQLMDQYGPVACDWIIQELGHLLDSLMRHDRGFDLITRFSGQCFLVLMADTGPRNVTSAIERIRQTVVKTTFEYAEDSIEISVRCGVAELGLQETADLFFGRLEAAVETAKRAGRNCTALDEGGGPQKIIAPEYNVKGRIIAFK